MKSNDESFTFYFTGGSKEYMFNGIKINLDLKMTPNQTKDYLESQISDKIDMKNKQLILYLSGCLPFNSGTLEDFFLCKEFNFSRIIYGVVTLRIPDSVLNCSYTELCNIKGPDRELLLSPLCKSSEIGLSDIACLLGYLNHDGIISEDFLRACSLLICFPPMITSMYKMIERGSVFGSDIVTVTSTLFTFFRSYLDKSKIKDKEVFNYALRLCCLISNENEKPELLPIQPIAVKFNKSVTLFSNLNLDSTIYLWKADMGEKFQHKCFQLTNGEEEILNAFNYSSNFRPISPLSMHFVAKTTIIRGKTHEYLYLSQSPLKGAKDQYNANIINPMTGLINTVNIEEFAKEQKDDKIDNFQYLIDRNEIMQIIMVNFDVSSFMKCDKDGNVIHSDKNKFSFFEAAYQYVMTFVSKIYNHNIPSIQGLITFASQIDYLCPLTPFFSDFLKKGLFKLPQPYGFSKMFDSLDKSIDEIINFRKDKKGNEKFAKAVSRIFLIFSGIDTKSTIKSHEIALKLVKNKIIVDSIVFDDNITCRDIATISHMTGGLCIKPKTLIDCLSIIEQSAFLNYNERYVKIIPIIKDNRKTIPKRIAYFPAIITPDFMNEARTNVYYDTEIFNIELIKSFRGYRFVTPAHVVNRNINFNINISCFRKRRILRELKYAIAFSDPNNENYDPDMKIFTLKPCLDIWRVFIKGLENTPYENKWWLIYVSFPINYPIKPPILRFASIPYHINVSHDGKICHHYLDNDYLPSMHVAEIIQEIKEIFILQERELAVEMEILDVYVNNPEEYNRLARKSAIENAKDDFMDYIKGINDPIEDDVDPDFQTTLERFII